MIRKIEQPSLLEVLDRVLDKGIVVDAWIRFSLAGIDFLTVEARIVVASIETYLQYAREFRTIQLQSSLPQILESIPGKTIQIKTRTGSS
ncbi:MAG TPA: gas vesicle structural protein GvpA [Candidatus Angelobacter sp.]